MEESFSRSPSLPVYFQTLEPAGVFFPWQAKEVTPTLQKTPGPQCWCYCATTAPEKICEHLQLFQGGKVRIILQMV